MEPEEIYGQYYDNYAPRKDWGRYFDAMCEKEDNDWGDNCDD